MLLDRTHSILANFPIPGLDPAILQAVHRPRLSLFWGTRAPAQTLLIMFTLLAARGETPRLFDGGHVRCGQGQPIDGVVRQVDDL